MIRVSTLIYLFTGYLVGAFFSDHIFMNLSHTHWNNLWVYFWLLLWPLGLLFYCGIWLLLVGLIGWGLFALWDRWERRQRIARRLRQSLRDY